MRVVGRYSLRDGEAYVRKHFSKELEEIECVIASTDSEQLKTKISREHNREGRRLYSPVLLNKAFRRAFEDRGWSSQRVQCQYPSKFYVTGYIPQTTPSGFREMDFVKNRLGVEVQFGKYAFMVYNVCAKMTIFKNKGFIEAGVEIVPVKEFAEQMSSGVSFFEQFVWDLESRGVADIDIPVLVLGVTAT